MRKLGDGHGSNELHRDKVRVGNRRLQLRLESYKGWARVGRRVAIVIWGSVDPQFCPLTLAFIL